MKGKYLRKKGQSTDPTMTHVADPHAFKVGDYIRDSWGWTRIAKIDEAQFGNPDIRFAHLEDVPEPGTDGAAHDVRTPESESAARAYREHYGQDVP